MRKSKVYIALLHYPVYNKKMEVITTSITNLDIHDIARVARTYEVDGFFWRIHLQRKGSSPGRFSIIGSAVMGESIILIARRRFG